MALRLLANVAERIGRSRPEVAIAIAEFNLTRHPKDPQTYLTVGQIHVARGDTASAVRAFQRGLEHLPDNQFFQAALRQLRGR